MRKKKFQGLTPRFNAYGVSKNRAMARLYKRRNVLRRPFINCSLFKKNVFHKSKIVIFINFVFSFRLLISAKDFPFLADQLILRSLN